MPRTYLMLLWHMHQPFYKDLAEDVYTMPWVRLHALKDYYGMVAILREFPSLHMTFNLVPSLVAQLQEYARDCARDPTFEAAFKPVAEFTAADRETLLDSAFQVNVDNLLNRFQRFRELWEKWRSGIGRTLARLFTAQDLLDLQVVSQLAWFDEIYLADDEAIGRLVAKERGYTEEDKSLLRSKCIELFNKVLEEYRDAAARGQVELSTSPFYHPILPLLCDTRVALESHPGVRLPRRAFRHPEDARDQLRAAVELHQNVFGVRPRGLWPSEGSVSEEVLRLATEEGFEWAAADEGVLGRSLQIGFFRQADGTPQNSPVLYRPHAFEAGDRRIALFFRDHQMSDLIGFVYARMDPEQAAADLHQRLRTAGRSTGGQPAVVSVILDGENAWEYYRGNGREFLRRFYARVAEDPDLQSVTASEALKLVEPGTLTRVVPGSWINANFDVWIGADEDNRAWDLLTDARDFYAQNASRAGVEAKRARLAREELWIAEGSDWCWWYGPEHSTANDEEFDLLFRKHLSNIYRLLDGSPPDELAVPIKRPRARAMTVPPTGRIEPQVDGLVTTYFEWLGAGLYIPDYHSGSMHGAAPHLEALYYGYSDKALYLRLDFTEAFLQGHEEFEVRVVIDGENRAQLHVLAGRGGVRSVDLWKRGEQVLVPLATGEQVQVAFARVFELRLDHGLLGFGLHEIVHLQVSIWANELPLQVIPQEGWLNLELAEDLESW
jgi:alpha-amylase/alpha-mannosidase (GH57 family)